MENKTTKNVFLLVIILLTLVATTASLILVSQKQELRKSAYVEQGGTVTVSISPTSGEMTAGEPFPVQLKLNTQTTAIDGLTVSLEYPCNEASAPIAVQNGVDGIVINQSVFPDSDWPTKVKTVNYNQETHKYVISLMIAPKPLAPAYSSNGNEVTLATFSLIASQAPTTSPTVLSFNSLSKAMANVDGTRRDVLQRPQTSLSLTMGAEVTPSPMPSPEPGKGNLTFTLKLEGISSRKPNQKAKVIFRQGDTVKYSFIENGGVTISSNDQGIFSGTVSNLDPGIYTVLVKEAKRLARKFENVEIVEGENTKNFTNKPLLAGDAYHADGEDIDGTGTDTISILDFGVLRNDYIPNTPSNSRADFDLSGSVNILDFHFIAQNYAAQGER